MSWQAYVDDRLMCEIEGNHRRRQIPVCPDLLIMAVLPEKHKYLLESFDSMTASLRLLNLRKQLPIFRNICRQVETLTGRKFSKKNLAQIKYILPEVVLTEKILVRNDDTCCMELDMKVTLNFDVVEGHRERSDVEALSKIFSSRLFELVNEHSEDFDVPEAELPELPVPFNRKKITVSAPALPVGSLIETLPNIAEAELLNPSHLPPSFKRRFSREITVADPALSGQGDTSKKRVKMCLFCSGRGHYDRECKHGD